MILALNTSSRTLEIWIDTNYWQIETDRNLARELLGTIRDKLASVAGQQYLTDQQLFANLTGIIIFKGPGSFTGLRIGATVANALADSLHIPIVGETGEDWREQGDKRLRASANDRVVLPEYGASANISTPRK